MSGLLTEKHLKHVCKRSRLLPSQPSLSREDVDHVILAALFRILSGKSR